MKQIIRESTIKSQYLKLTWNPKARPRDSQTKIIK